MTQFDVDVVDWLAGPDLDIPAADFEAGVDKFLDTVEARLSLRVPNEREFAQLRDELREERSDPELSRICRLQARAGFDRRCSELAWWSLRR